MIDSFGIYYEDEENNDLGLVAAGSQWTSGGNSALARRARVAMQRRDRYGRWAEMGGGISFPGRLSDGRVKKLIGRYVGPADREGYMRVYVAEGAFGYRAGIYEVPGKVATASKAILTGETLKEAGVNLDVNGKSVGDVLDRDIEFTAGMFKGEPNSLDLQMAEGKVSTGEKKRIVKARLKAPAHKSYNVVDTKGKRVDKDPEAPKPEKAKAEGEKFPLPELPEVLPGDDEKTAKKKKKERARREWWVDEEGKRLKDEQVTDEIKADPSRLRIRDVENHRVLDGNGNEIKFDPKFETKFSPLPKDKGGEQPREADDGFWNVNEVSEDEVQKDITDPQQVYEIMYDGGFVEVDQDVAIEAVRIAQEDFKFLGKVPDDQIHFKSNPTDPIFREISNLLQGLPTKQQERARRAINLGIMSKPQLDELKAFLENSPKGEDDALSPEDFASLHRKFRNMGVDITNMRLKGKKYFSNDNLGAQRINMPQLDADEQADFIAYAKSLGINITAGSKRPEQLSPVQAEMDMGDVGNIMTSWLSPEERAKWKMDDGVLFVTRDGYVLDGHHRWSSALLAELAGAGDINLKVQVIDLDHEDALKLVNAWNDHVGIGRIAVGGKNVAETRPVPGQVGRKATLPEAPAVAETVTPDAPQVTEWADNGRGDRAIARAFRSPGSANQLPTNEQQLKELLDSVVPSREDLVDVNLLSDDRVEKDTGVNAPSNRGKDKDSIFFGGKTIFKNLTENRKKIIEALKEIALDGETERFNQQFSMLKRITSLINQIHDNQVAGLPDVKNLENMRSTRDMGAKLGTFEILPNSIKTEIGTRGPFAGKSIITSLDAVMIGKDGKPYLYKARFSGSGSQVYAYPLNPDGTVSGDAVSKLGLVSPYRGFADESDASGGYAIPGQPLPGITNTMFTDYEYHGAGLASGAVFLARWVAERDGGRMSHSTTLYPPGNFYSKTISNFRDNNRQQADKNAHQNNPKAELFKAMKAARLIDGEYKPYDRQNPLQWGTGWLKRLIVSHKNNVGSEGNYSVLDKITYDVRNSLVELKKWYEQNKTPENLEQIPEIFRKFVASGQKEDWSDWDIQYNLLDTIYTDGPSKEQSIKMLDDILSGVEALRSLATDPNGEQRFPFRALLTSRQITELRNQLEAITFDPANRIERPKPFPVNAFRIAPSPFAGYFKFSDWKVPNGVRRVENELPFSPRPSSITDPEGWTENPTDLASMFDGDTLAIALKQAIVDNKGGKAKLTFRGGEGEVDPNSLFKALEEKGEDANLFIARVYDEMNGDSANVDKLNEVRSGLIDINSVMNRHRASLGELERPVEFANIGGRFDAENRKIIGDSVKRDENDPDGLINLEPLRNDNKGWFGLDGTLLLNAVPYTPSLRGRDWILSGITDSPKIIARNFSTEALRDGLLDAIENGKATVTLQFPSDVSRSVPLAAIRDALQHQGFDVNKLLEDNPKTKPIPGRFRLIGQEEVSEDDTSVTRVRYLSMVSPDATYQNEMPVARQSVIKSKSTGEITGYSIVTYPNLNDAKSESNGTRVATLKENGAGQFEVYIPRSEGDDAKATYTRRAAALYDIGEYLKRQLNLDGQGEVLRDNGSEDASRQERQELALVRFNSWNVEDSEWDNPDNDVAALGLPSPEDGVETREIYTAPSRLSADGIDGNGTKVMVIDRGTGTLIESVKVTKGDGTLITAHSVEAIDLGESVKAWKVSGMEMNTRVFSNKEDAVKYARSNSLLQGLISPNQEGLEAEPFDPAINLGAGNLLRSVVISTRNLTTQKESTSRFTRNDGEIIDAHAIVKKGATPSWNTPEGRDYTFAFVKISRPNAGENEPPLATFSVKRIGSRTWKLEYTNSTGSVDSLRGIRGHGDGQGEALTFSTKTEAFEALKIAVDTNYLNKADGVDSPLDSAIPIVRIVDLPHDRLVRENRLREEADRARRAEEGNRARAERLAERRRQKEAGEIPQLQIPRDNDIVTDEDFQDFLARRAEIIDIPEIAISRWPHGGNAGEAKLVTLPDGRKFKMKNASVSDRGYAADRRRLNRSNNQPDFGARNEALVHAIYELANSPASIGGLGRLEDGTIVLLDEYLPNIRNVSPQDIMRLPRVNPQRVGYYDDPAYAQAKQDLQDSVLINALLGHHDYFGHPTNWQVVDTPEGIRGLAVDGGGAGLVNAWARNLNGEFAMPGANSNWLKYKFGDFMTTGIVNGADVPGEFNRGMTKQDMIDSARKHLLPLTRERVEALAEIHFTNPDLVKKFTDILIARRDVALRYMGIDPNEAPAVVPGQVPAPNAYENSLEQMLNPRDGRVPSLEVDGYSLPWMIPESGLPKYDSRGRVIVEVPVNRDIQNGFNILRTTGGPAVPPVLQRAIREGRVAVFNQPFSEFVQEADGSIPLVIDKDGRRHLGRFGAKVSIIRKRMADGSYKYLLHKPSGPFLSRDFGDIVKDQYMPAIEPNRRIGANDMIDGKLIADAHLGVDVPVVRTITRTLGGRSNDPIEASRVDILDIGDAELDLSQNERVTDAKWVSADDLDTLNITGSLVDQLQGTEFKQILLDAERDAESPVTNANPGNEVVNEDNPNMARQWNNGRYNVTVYGENGAVGDDKIVARILVNGVNFGEVRKTYHGHYAATLLPTQGTRGVRNGSTVKAIFASETEAKDWLQMAVQKRVEPNNDQPINIFFGTLPRLMNANDRNATPIFKVTGGYLNPTTDEQRRLANRLIETKQTTPENRALYRAILAEQELSNGEVGWVIGNLINAEDRDAAEIEQSREGRNGGDGGGTPVGPTTAENNGGTGTGEGSIRAGELRAGQRLLGKYNADVAFVVPGENDTVNIGLIDSNGKLSIYKVNKNSVLPVSNRQDVNPPAVVNNPVVARNRQQVFAIQSAIRQAYPNARELPNGDFAVAQRDYRQADGTVFRYEAMVTKLDSDEFVSYVRQQQIDAQGNPIGDAKVAYLAEPGHSPRAVLNRLERQAMSVINSPVPANGFRQRGDIQNESVHPGHGQLVPESLVPNQNARYIGDTGIESTGNATKDALVGYMNNLIIRGMATPEIMEQLTRGNQNLFSKNQLEDILERLDANRMHPGVNIIPYVSRNKVIARVGDIIQHVDADGNVIKSGKVTGRRPITVNRKPNGEYVYTDQLYAKWDGLPGNSRQVAARRVIVLRRADGSEPTPAVISPNPDAPVNTPVIPDLPKQQGGNDSVVPDAIPNYDMLGLVNRVRVAEALQKVLSPDLRVSIDEDPESAKIQVRSEGRFVGAIRQLADGRYKAYFNDVNAMVYEENWDKLQDAIDFMKNGIGREFLNQRNNQQVDSAENDNRLLVDRNRELLRNKFDAGAEVIDGRTPTGNANIILWPMRPGSNKRATIRVGEDGMFEVRNWDSENGGDDTTFWATYDGALQRVREYLETDGGNEGGQEIDPIAIDAIYEHLNDYINYSVVPAPNHPVSLQVDSESGRQFAEWQGDVDDKKAHLWVNPTNGNIVATLWSNKNINSSKRDIEFTPAGIDRDSVQVSMIQAENEIQRFLNASPDDIEIVEPSEPSEQLDSPIIKGLISLQDSDLDRIAEENGRGQNYNLKKGLEPSSVLYYKTDANGNAITGEAEGSLFVTDGIVKMNFWEDGVLVSSETYKGEGNATDAIREMVSRVNARLTERGVTVNRVVGRGVTAKPNENQLYIDNKARFDSVVNGFEIPKVDGVDGVLADGAIVWYARPGLEQKRSVLKVDPATGYFYVTTSTDDAVRERYFETYEEAMSEINSFMSPRGGEVDAPVVAPEVPQGDVALPDGYSFSVDGDDIFTAGAADGGNGRMYAVGERGTDGQWSVRVHANARDAMRNQNALSTSTHATKEDAKRAVANELASRENPEPSAPILQWQDGSDGNPYIGLAGVAGIAPESAPILMVVPGPNGTWSVQMWRNQADFDAGRAPARSYDRPSKDDARQRAMEDAEALVALLGNSGN